VARPKPASSASEGFVEVFDVVGQDRERPAQREPYQIVDQGRLDRRAFVPAAVLPSGGPQAVPAAIATNRTQLEGNSRPPAPIRLRDLAVELIEQSACSREVRVRVAATEPQYDRTGQLRFERASVEKTRAARSSDTAHPQAGASPARRSQRTAAQRQQRRTASDQRGRGQIGSDCGRIARVVLLHTRQRAEALDQLDRSTRASLRVARQHLHHERIESFRNVAGVVRGKTRCGPPMIRQFGERARRIGVVSAQQVVRERAQRIDVRASIECLARDVLRRNEWWCPSDEAVDAHRRHRSKVDQLRVAVRCAVDVPR
jgi:hypothetical protein